MTLTAKSELWVCEKIRKMIHNDIDLLKVSISFRVNPTPLRKVMAGKPVSKYWMKKLYIELKKEKDPNAVYFCSPTVKRLLSIYRMYQENGTLDKVARNLGLSRERIRQLLKKGAKLGLFDYQKIKRKPLPDIPKEKIIKDYDHLLRLREVAKINEISSAQLNHLLQFHQIRKQTLESIQMKRQKERCVKQYFEMVDKLGRHPSTAELQKTYEGHYLSDKIIRFWSSIHIFRQELNIPFFPRNRSRINGGPESPGAELGIPASPQKINNMTSKKGQ